jgi:glucosamine--fructose-6-phosphate aminotransferase (isomerizing)
MAAVEGVPVSRTRAGRSLCLSERNAHPHASGDLVVVHNGIIENHDVMRKELRAWVSNFVRD